MNTIAMGVMTYNHPDTVEHVLSLCCDVYRACELDVYYYDSSENDDTKKVVESYIQKGYENLHYLSCVNGTGKMEGFWNGYGMEKKYDYYWLAKDRTACDSYTLLKLYQYALFEKPDMIVIDTYGDHTEERSRIISDPCVLYREYGWEMTSMDVVLVRAERMLKGKYIDLSDCELYSPRATFPHYDLYFHRLLELENPKICILSEPKVELLNSTKSGSGWIKRIFEIWADLWIRENENLPEVYAPYKEEVIRSDAVPELLKSEAGLRQLYDMGILTPEKAADPVLAKNWRRVSDVPIQRLQQIAEGKQ